MVEGIRIDPQAFYDDVMLSSLLGIGSQTFATARRSGELRSVRKGQRILYLGTWVIAWLTADPSPADEKEMV